MTTCQTGCSTEPAIKQTPKLNNKTCGKCEKKSMIITRMKGFCDDCFTELVEHKFKSSLRLKCDIKKDTLLLCLSGGPNSFSLLKMATKAVQSNTLGKKMFFKIEVLYIDETVLYQNENQKVISFLDQNELSYKVIKIEDIFDSNSDIVGEQQTEGKTNKEKFLSLLDSIKDLGSSKEDFLYNIKQQLIVEYARSKEIKKVILGTTGQKVAINFMSQVCKGNGHNIPNLVSPKSDHIEGVDICKPMIELLKKEIMYYIRIQSIDDFILYNPNISAQSSGKKFPGMGSIDQLIENTLDRLQDEQSSTIYTILQSGDKIKNKYSHFEQNQFCPICYSKRDKMINVLEVGGIQDFAKNQEINDKLNEIYLQSDLFKSKSSMEKQCCFSCQRSIQNSKPEMVDKLPEVFKKNLQVIEDQYCQIQENDVGELIKQHFVQQAQQ